MLSYKSIIEKGRRQYGVVFNTQLIFSAFEIKFKPQTSYEIDLPSLSVKSFDKLENILLGDI